MANGVWESFIPRGPHSFSLRIASQQVEEIIQQLLDGLRDKDTVVRWSAAKGSPFAIARRLFAVLLCCVPEEIASPRPLPDFVAACPEQASVAW
mgnify:CR=1 FL=1